MIKQPLIVPVSLNGVDQYQLVEDFPYKIWAATEVARAGYLFDGASVPRFAWWFMPPDGMHRREALKHDWGYDGRGVMENGLILSRGRIDLEFGVGLSQIPSMKKWKAELCYQAVHRYGEKAWLEGDGTRLILPVGSLAPATGRGKLNLFRHLYDEPHEEDLY